MESRRPGHDKLHSQMSRCPSPSYSNPSKSQNNNRKRFPDHPVRNHPEHLEQPGSLSLSEPKHGQDHIDHNCRSPRNTPKRLVIPPIFLRDFLLLLVQRLNCLCLGSLHRIRVPAPFVHLLPQFSIGALEFFTQALDHGDLLRGVRVSIGGKSCPQMELGDGE